MKVGKCPVVDDIPAEVLKKGVHNVTTYFHKLCTEIWNQREWPEDWKTSMFVVLPEKDDNI